jgi:hypothetical protein
MPLNFEPRLGSAVDTATGLTIYAPRILPASAQEDLDRTEYEYSLYLHGEWFDGLSFLGTNSSIKNKNRREWVFTLDLDCGWILDSIFRIKQRLDNKDGDFMFLQNIADGLVGVFKKDTNNDDDDFRYLALTNKDILAQHEIIVPNHSVRLVNSEIVLAEAFLPALINRGNAV